MGDNSPLASHNARIVVWNCGGGFHKKWRTVADLQPDIAVIHALKADPAGNAIIGNNKAIDEDLVGASQIVVITAEEIVPELEKADIVAPYVDAVVHTPLGALPSSCHPNYPIDGKAIMDYIENVGNPASFQSFLGGYLK